MAFVYNDGGGGTGAAFAATFGLPGEGGGDGLHVECQPEPEPWTTVLRRRVAGVSPGGSPTLSFERE